MMLPPPKQGYFANTTCAFSTPCRHIHDGFLLEGYQGNRYARSPASIKTHPELLARQVHSGGTRLTYHIFYNIMEVLESKSRTKTNERDIISFLRETRARLHTKFPTVTHAVYFTRGILCHNRVLIEKR